MPVHVITFKWGIYVSNGVALKDICEVLFSQQDSIIYRTTWVYLILKPVCTGTSGTIFCYKRGVCCNIVDLQNRKTHISIPQAKIQPCDWSISVQ